MIKGKSIGELAAELERQQGSKRDFIAPAAKLSLESSPVGYQLNLQGVDNFGTTNLFHEQVGGFCDIPRKYYDRMRTEQPDLLCSNVNRWLSVTGASKRMVRTLDGNARSLLSERYRALDNYDLAEAILPIFTEDGDFRVLSSEITERKMYIQVVNERIKSEVKRGDAVQAGIVISNSEVGCGSLSVEPMIYRLVCTNGMIAGKALRKYHVGRAGGSDLDDASEYFRDETRRADDRAFWLKVQDVVRGAFDMARFEWAVRKLSEAAETTLPAEADIPAVVEVTAKLYGFSDGEKRNVLNRFIKDGDLSKFGLLNAVTRTAEDLPDYDRAIEFERFGGDILELPQKQWERMAEARIEDGELVAVR